MAASEKRQKEKMERYDKFLDLMSKLVVMCAPLVGCSRIFFSAFILLVYAGSVQDVI